MKIETVTSVNPAAPKNAGSQTEEVTQGMGSEAVLAEKVAGRDEKKVAPEEVLGKIQSLTENGLYSVRFEMNQDAERLVVKVVDQQSGELIRQIPPEDFLGTAKRLRDLRGVLFETKS